MRSRYLLPALLSAALVAGASQPAADVHPAPPLIIKDIGPGEVPIDGDWQFHPGDDMRWASPAYDDSQWEHIKTDKPWGAQTHPSYTGFAWYRRHVEIEPSPAGKQKLAILMPPVQNAYEVYWNGEKVGNLGTFPPEAVWYFAHRQSFALPLTSSSGSDGVLALRVWRAPLSSLDYATGGGLYAPPRIGDSDVIAATVGNGDFQSLRESLYARAISYLFLLMAALSFFAWMRSRDKKLYLWFALWLLAKGLQFYTTSDQAIAGLSAVSGTNLLSADYSMEDCSLFLLLLYLFNLQDNPRVLRWTRIAICINISFALASGVVTLFWGNEGVTLQWISGVLSTVFYLSEFFVLVLTYQGLKRPLDLPRKLVAVIAFLVYLRGTVTILTAEGQRFTHLDLYRKMKAPLFHIFGTAIRARQILETSLILSVVYAILRYAMEQRRREEAIEMELKSAQEVQRVMIPDALPEVAGYAIQSVYLPAQEVGGDFYQIIPLKDESSLVVLGDVSGKGLKAAMNVALIIGTLRTLAEFDSDPAMVLTGLNRRLVGRLQGGFATTVVLRLGPSGDCTFANAGHLPPFMNSGELTMEPSLPLGIVAEADYVDQSIVLNDDDRVTLYTDGVLEACNSAGELTDLNASRRCSQSVPTPNPLPLSHAPSARKMTSQS